MLWLLLFSWIFGFLLWMWHFSIDAPKASTHTLRGGCLLGNYKLCNTYSPYYVCAVNFAILIRFPDMENYFVYEASTQSHRCNHRIVYTVCTPNTNTRNDFNFEIKQIDRVWNVNNGFRLVFLMMMIGASLRWCTIFSCPHKLRSSLGHSLKCCNQ